VKAFILPDAVLPLTVHDDGAAWTVWDARAQTVLRTEDGARSVANRADAQSLADRPTAAIDLSAPEAME
jgi:hypothetical protein